MDVERVTTAHRAGILRLFEAASGFDASVPRWTTRELAALADEGIDEWRVAAGPEGAPVGAMIVRRLGSRRTRLWIVVNPAFRRRGVGRALVAQAPQRRRLLISSRAGLDAASAFLTSLNFSERHRRLRLRRALTDMPSARFPENVVLEPSASAARFLAVAPDALDEHETNAALLSARLEEDRACGLFLKIDGVDQGVAVLRPLDRPKRSEIDGEGRSLVGFVQQIGLTKAARGRGLSRPLLRAGLDALGRLGYLYVEALVDGRRPRAAELYRADGFQEVDQEIEWIRRDDERAVESQI